jgi:hypothetical protein
LAWLGRYSKGTKRNYVTLNTERLVGELPGQWDELQRLLAEVEVSELAKRS